MVGAVKPTAINRVVRIRIREAIASPKSRMNPSYWI
jgi:hypothetical protein